MTYSINGNTVVIDTSRNANVATLSVTSNTVTIGTAAYVVANGNIGIGNTTPAHKLRVDGDISLSGGVHANGSSGSNGQVLTSNGSVVYWAAAASAVSKNVVQTVKTDTATRASNTTFADVGLSVTITLENATNGVDLTAALSVGGINNTTTPLVAFIFLRGETILTVADASANKILAMTTIDPPEISSMSSGICKFLDYPGSVGPHTYKLQWATNITSGTICLNRSGQDANGSIRGISTLTAMEVR